MTNKLDVMIWGKKAGTLIESKEGYRKRVCFYFDPGFVKSGLDIAPLRAPVNGPVAQNGMPVYPKSDMLEIAKRFGIKSAEATISKSIEVAKNYRKHGEEVGVPEVWIKRIEEEISENIKQL